MGIDSDMHTAGIVLYRADEDRDPVSPFTVAVKEMLADPELAFRAPFAMTSKRWVPLAGVKEQSKPAPIRTPSRYQSTARFDVSAALRLTVTGCRALTVSLIPRIVHSTGTPSWLTRVKPEGTLAYLSNCSVITPSVVLLPTILTTSAHPATAVPPLKSWAFKR